MSSGLIASLEQARAAERGQALFYRALAAEAERREDAALSERFNELHADEQHHLSRISARLLELGVSLADLGDPHLPAVDVEGWEQVAQPREDEEVRRYEALLGDDLDDETRELLEMILDTERHHAAELGGKWTTA